jgi:hypothetical protein
VFPFEMPFTLHESAVFVVLVTVGMKVWRWSKLSDALVGEMATLMLLVIVTVAAAEAEPAVAWISNELGDGRFCGAVNVAVVAPVTTSVPSVEFPPATPFTSQEICAADAAHSDAVKVWGWPRLTSADEGEMEFAAAQVIVTVAVPDFAGSAVLVAVIVTFGGESTAAGAV